MHLPHNSIVTQYHVLNILTAYSIYMYKQYIKLCLIGLCFFHKLMYVQFLHVSTDSQPISPHPPPLLCHGIRTMQQSSITGLADAVRMLFKFICMC